VTPAGAALPARGSRREKSIAVLFDAENIAPAWVGPVLGEVARHGIASIKRAYGDWTRPDLRRWKEAASEHVVQPIQQFQNSVGKNASDSALIIDAMDILYSGRIDAFAIVSSDGDFTRLAARIREDGIPVLGYGERKTPSAFRNACDQFTYFDLLEGATPARERDGATKTSSPGGDAKLVALLRAAVLATADEQGWANLSPVGQHVRKNAPDFDSRNWGFARLSELVKATERFHMKTRGTTIVVADKALVP